MRYRLLLGHSALAIPKMLWNSAFWRHSKENLGFLAPSFEASYEINSSCFCDLARKDTHCHTVPKGLTHISCMLSSYSGVQVLSILELLWGPSKSYSCPSFKRTIKMGISEDQNKIFTCTAKFSFLKLKKVIVLQLVSPFHFETWYCEKSGFERLNFQQPKTQ